MKKSSVFVLSALSTLALTACTATMENRLKADGRYWQRIDTTDAIYQQGPKAQQMLFQDMARCTSDINELQRLSAIRKAVPADTFDQNFNKVDPNSAKARMGDWDTPARDGYLRSEHYDYTDFEGCMTFKGWERVEYVNSKMVERARNDYLDAIGVERYRTITNERAKTPEYND